MSRSPEEARVLDWLLEADQPAVRYFVLKDLLDRPDTDTEVRFARSQIAERGWGREILDRQKKEGYWESRESLYGPKYTASNWMALVLSDLGLTLSDPRVERAAQLFFHDWLGDDVPKETEICVLGNLTRFLTRFGYAEHEKVKGLFDLIVELQKEDGGWHCWESETGTLDCWEGLGAYASLPRSLWTRSIKRSAERGAEFYLERKLLNEGTRYSPWYRLHYPNHYYYDVLVGLDTVTALGFAGDKRLGPALRVLEEKRSSGGTWAIEAAHPDLARGAKYKMKRVPAPFQLEGVGEPSKWITMKSLRVLKRVSEG